MAKVILTIVIVFALSLDLASTVPRPSPQETQGTNRGLKDVVNDELDQIYGGSCSTDDSCSVLSHCDNDNRTCMLNWWVILILIAFVCLFLFAFCSCICCPCCCLYQCCESICCCC